MSVFIVATDTGTVEFDEVMENALAQTLLTMLGPVSEIVIQELDLDITKVHRDPESGGIDLEVDEAPQVTERRLKLGEDQQHVIAQLNTMAELMELSRDGLMTSLLGDVKNVEAVRRGLPESKPEVADDGTGSDGTEDPGPEQ